MLIVLPIPALWIIRLTWQRKLQVGALLTLGFFIIAITLIRLPINVANASSQVNRTTWASTELLMAAIAVNAPTLYGTINKWRKLRAKSNASGSGHAAGVIYEGQGSRRYGTTSAQVTSGGTELEDQSSRGSVVGIQRTRQVIVRNRRYSELCEEENASIGQSSKDQLWIGRSE